ncbi:sulfite exporter TauE/SafE family protein [Phaeacidiphilus oryzae]|uniref:sulfite exporter TauE/SafE family protein n=1 Tax=Phaeacidiphilus oryzae TaxID=348818 RepID=UPI000B0AB41C|nr:sulfite exporter TauE/SafE family protein [Phaeacidiphilus oryzae]
MGGDWAPELLLAAIVFVGAAVQRMSGIGFALVAGPGLIALQGPLQGVLLANCASCGISALGLATEWRGLRPRVMVPLVAAAACLVPVGAWAAGALPRPVLLVGIGATVVAAVAVIARGVRSAALSGRSGAVIAGAASGFMNAAAGVGGPAVSLYALNEGWSVREFVPNALFYGVLVNALSVALKGPPRLPGAAWALIACALLAGLPAGRFLAARVPDRRARGLVLLLACAGGLVTLGRGLGAF